MGNRVIFSILLGFVCFLPPEGSAETPFRPMKAIKKPFKVLKNNLSHWRESGQDPAPEVYAPLDEQTQMQEHIRASQPLVYRSFIPPSKSFKTDHQNAHQLTPLYLSTYYNDGAGFLAHTGGQKLQRMKGTLKLMLLVEVQYRFGVVVSALPLADRNKLVEQRFFEHLQDAQAGTGKRLRRIQRTRERPIPGSIPPSQRIDQEAEFKQTYSKASPEELILVFNRLTKILMGKFLMSPLLPVDKAYFASPDDSRLYTPRALREFKRRPALLRCKGYDVVLKSLLLIREYLQGNPFEMDPSKRKTRVQALYKGYFKSYSGTLSETELQAAIFHLINEIEQLTGLDTLYAELKKRADGPQL